MNIVGPVLALGAFMFTVVVLLTIVAMAATAARVTRDRREERRLVGSVEAALRQAAGDRQEPP